MSPTPSPTTGEPGPADGLPSRRTLIRRAALVGAAVWTAPVLLDSVTSPAAAASCTRYTLDWNSFAVGAGGATVKGTGPTANVYMSGTGTKLPLTPWTAGTVGGVTISFLATGASGTTLLTAASNGGNGNLTVRAADNGGIVGQQALQLQMVPSTTSVSQTVAITFSKAVTNVSFTLYDIDNITGAGWGDRVSFNIAPTSVSTTNAAWSPNTSAVTGLGTAASPLLNTAANNNASDASSLGNATLTWTGPVTTLNLTYSNKVNTGSANQRIGIGPITYCA